MPQKIILVVDDNTVNRALLHAVLEQSYQVQDAADGEEALALIRLAPPALVITDILMPKMDGYDLVKAMAKDPMLRLIPVIFYTANYTYEAAASLGHPLGVQKILVKPVHPSEILSAVEAALASGDKHLLTPDPVIEEEHLRIVNQSFLERMDLMEAARVELEGRAQKLRKVVREDLLAGLERTVAELERSRSNIQEFLTHHAL